jgi:glycine hydroxymethyltransferase
VVTTTTHKTLRGPRAGLIFFRKIDRNGQDTGLESRINSAVFPSCQGGPHDNTIAAIAVALKQAATPEFRRYAALTRENCKALAESLMSMGHDLVTNGTDNHLFLWDLRKHSISGSKMEKMCEIVDISINKNSIKGDLSAVTPGGVRLGTAALTTRGLGPEDMSVVAGYLDEALTLALQIQKQSGSKLLKDFVEAASKSEKAAELKLRVHSFAKKFPMPGHN